MVPLPLPWFFLVYGRSTAAKVHHLCQRHLTKTFTYQFVSAFSGHPSTHRIFIYRYACALYSYLQFGARCRALQRPGIAQRSASLWAKPVWKIKSVKKYRLFSAWIASLTARRLLSFRRRQRYALEMGHKCCWQKQNPTAIGISRLSS